MVTTIALLGGCNSRKGCARDMDKAFFDYEVQFGGFDKLMPYRIREILLVSSPYDSSSIAEDDRLTELIFSEYLDLRLHYAPRVTRASSAKESLDHIRKGRFDMILTMMRVGNMDVIEFAREVKKISPALPVILLAYNLLDVERLRAENFAGIDHVFLWLGDVKILLAIIKLLEDRMNIDQDLKAAGVQTILLIEDSVRFYSAYLPLIYSELMKQTRLLIAEGVNLSHKMLRMRARPKILMASTYEEAMALYRQYRSNLLGLISDVQFPREGKLDPEAGFRFASLVKQDSWDMPVLLQSVDSTAAARAREIGASFLNKHSESLLSELRQFILEFFGFGDFIFRSPSGDELGRVADLHAMVNLLPKIPAESVAYHANRNHFSRWLKARTEFELAHRIRPVALADFKTVDDLRSYLIRNFERSLHQAQIGVTVNFSPEYFTPDINFVKIGSGSLGGKARGIAFFNTLMGRSSFTHRFEGARIAIPNTAVVATDLFDAFMEQNDLYPIIHEDVGDESLRDTCVSAALPQSLMKDLKGFVEKVRYPLAVRSSSLMEDSQSQPFAGIYETYLLPNSHPDARVRLEQLCRAIKLVYASTFSREARAYLGTTPHLQDEEKMAVILQRLVGCRYADRFYPSFSGVAQSYNFYPMPPIQPEDGAAHVALGLGKAVVDGYRVLRFSPAHPRHLHQFATLNDYLNNSQKEFLALDMRHPEHPVDYDSSANLVRLGLDAAEQDGTLQALGSTYSVENQAVYDGISRPGPRLVTFAHILKHRMFPLAEMLKFVLEISTEAIGCHVEMEFAVDLAERIFYILQMRPMTALENGVKVNLQDIDMGKAVCHSRRALGHGFIDDLADVVYVKPEAFNPADSKTIAREIGEINDRLRKEGHGYVLIGPGRWGTADPWLGIPVTWGQISAARLIIETTLPGFIVDPSFGTHFLHNVTALGIGYFTINHVAGDGNIDWRWLHDQKAVSESSRLRHVRLPKPLDVRIDGRSGEGVVLRS
ncbi:MAG: PEP/pyruvate-binding domain-containing protein [Acidobacteriota bacterium]